VITEEMKRFFVLRTRSHLFLVRKWSDKITDLNHAQIDNTLLNKERDDHDEFKWLEPEYTPYVLITWDYEQKRLKKEFSLPAEIKEKMNDATLHHIKRHKHHPEFWDENVGNDSLNRENRDMPPKRMVDGTKMPLTYVAAMVADWLAMSEELGTCPYQWVEKNVNVRWSFTQEQVHFINRLIEAVWPLPKA